MPTLEQPATRLNAAGRIEREMTVAILKGQHKAGERLPTISALAQARDVTVPTMQRVIARLEARGLVTVRQGSGVYVTDPARSASLDCLPELFAVCASDVAASAELLATLLRLRRMLLRDIVEQPQDVLAKIATHIAEFSGYIQGAGTPAETAELDLELNSRILDSTGQRAYGLVFNSFRRIVFSVPHVLEALYGDPEATHSNLLQGLRRLSAPDRTQSAADIIVGIAEAADADSVARYKTLLKAQSS